MGFCFERLFPKHESCSERPLGESGFSVLCLAVPQYFMGFDAQG